MITYEELRQTQDFKIYNKKLKINAIIFALIVAFFWIAIFFSNNPNYKMDIASVLFVGAFTLVALMGLHSAFIQKPECWKGVVVDKRNVTKIKKVNRHTIKKEVTEFGIEKDGQIIYGSDTSGFTKKACKPIDVGSEVFCFQYNKKSIYFISSN